MFQQMSADVKQLPIWKDVLHSIERNDLTSIMRGYVPFGKVTHGTESYAYRAGGQSIHLIIPCLILLLKSRKISYEQVNSELLSMANDFDFSLLALQYVTNCYQYYLEDLSDSTNFLIDFERILAKFISCKFTFPTDELIRLERRLVNFIQTKMKI